MIILSKETNLNVDDYINSQQYSDKVKKGGLEFLLNKWKYICSRIPYDCHYQYDEYLNDLLTRKVIHNVFKNCNIDKENVDKLREIDLIFKRKTIEIDECLWPVSGDLQLPYSKEEYWFFYRIPEERIPDWSPT